jgi:hypothetical protein
MASLNSWRLIAERHEEEEGWEEEEDYGKRRFF